MIAETVSTPLEEQINGVENMMYMKSVAGSDGVLQMTITFRPGTDPDAAQVVQNRVSQALLAAAVGSGQPRRHNAEAVADLLSDGSAPHRRANTTRSTRATTPTSRSRTNWRDCPVSARSR
ncbi:MAG: efflux RND transporter permease subunit [Nitrospira sp.]|nr:efflux RND transporter permease subunit [Nitrospira sp.]